MKELPKIYKNKINKKINHSSTVYYSGMNSYEKEKIDVLSFLDNLFREGGHIFNKALLIKTKDKVYDTAIISRSGDYIYTLSDEKILIKDILSIEKKK